MPKDIAYELVEISTIAIEGRSRAVDPAWVDVLAQEFARGEMVNPITLWRGKDGPTLVAGAHRLAAHIQNEETHIAVIWSKASSLAEAKVLEISENIVRHELTALDRAQHLFDLKEAYEALHPEVKHGAQGGRGGQKNEGEIISFSKDAAEKVGLTERAIQMAVAMWKGLSPKSKATIRGTWLADHQAGLMSLSKVGAKIQAKVLAMIFPPDGQQPKALNVADALYIIEHGRTLTSVEKRFAGLSKSIKALHDDELDALLTANEARIMAWVERHIGGDR